MGLSATRTFARNLLEFALIFALWGVGYEMVVRQWLSPAALTAAVLALAAAKTLFFGAENIGQLRLASKQNWPYHKFLLLMLMNAWQIITSFGLDYHLLHTLNRESFHEIKPALESASLVFEFLYYSALNFMFFGYGDITPQTIPAKVLTLTEITLAFVTVIFLLSDFISLKESLRNPPGEN
jgi:hypothetical protein